MKPGKKEQAELAGSVHRTGAGYYTGFSEIVAEPGVDVVALTAFWAAVEQLNTGLLKEKMQINLNPDTARKMNKKGNFTGEFRFFLKKTFNTITRHVTLALESKQQRIDMLRCFKDQFDTTRT